MTTDKFAPAPESTYEDVRRTIADTGGLVIRQKTQKTEVLAQALGIPYEQQNKYKVHLLPTDKCVKSEPFDPKGWAPTREELKALEVYLFAQEESDLCMRMLWANMRPLKMHISVNNTNGDVFVIDRPFQCGGCLCCPLEMNLDAVAGGNVRRIGRVRENFAPWLCKCCSAMCLATTYTDIERAMPGGSYEKAYTLRTNLACCGRTNNCCGPSCCQNDAVYDILDTHGKVVAHLQMTFARGQNCLEACGRAEFDFNNYLLEFPPSSTAEDRMLLLTALFQVEYQLFERKEK